MFYRNLRKFANVFIVEKVYENGHNATYLKYKQKTFELGEKVLEYRWSTELPVMVNLFSGDCFVTIEELKQKLKRTIDKASVIKMKSVKS